MGLSPTIVPGLRRHVTVLDVGGEYGGYIKRVDEEGYLICVESFQKCIKGRVKRERKEKKS